MRQGLRQACGAHPSLYQFNVIRYSPEFDRLVLQIRDRETRSRIAVAWLANGAGIQQVALLRLNTKRAVSFVVSRMELQNFELRILISKAALMVSVSVKSDLQRGIQQAF